MLYFSQTIEHSNLKLGPVVGCEKGLPKMHSLITSRKGQKLSEAINMQNIGFLTNLHCKVSLMYRCIALGFVHCWHRRAGQNFNVELFLETIRIDNRTLKLGMMVVCDESFPKMHSLITSLKGQSSSGAIISAEKAPKL